GGYHGHFDRLSIASFIKDNQTFTNNEYAWYSYDSFLFKMWVQTSMAHNMVVVDGRMQMPAPCKCIYYHDGADFKAVAAQTISRWCDPPYGGQTPYPYIFPEEKCIREGRQILPPLQAREQGAIGEYSEEVYAKRLLILFHGYCITWDYLEGTKEHDFDCLYHPHGVFRNENNLKFDTYRERFSEDPYNAGQFILHCYTALCDGTVRLAFHDAQPRVNPNDIIDFVKESAVWRVCPQVGEVTLARYPQSADNFTAENIEQTRAYWHQGLKKTVSFHSHGTSARFVTILEIGENTDILKSATMQKDGTLKLSEADGQEWTVSVEGMDARGEEIRVKVVREDYENCVNTDKTE
ncbi:MAG: hypothetical protein K6G30_01585, partial [Acetatifactor sp.]|nr:hypothetical protein [Acetatifactor sp.]